MTAHAQESEELILVKYPQYTKKSIDSVQFLKFQWHFTKKQNKTILKFVQNHKRSQIANVIMSKKNKDEGIKLSDFRLYYKTILIKTIWH